MNNPKSLTKVRPISLCNVGYKTITNTLTNRLKEVMPHLTAPSESSFVPGRQITDNIIIYQEVLHSMRSPRKGNGIMLLKIDLEKVYDPLSWNFIKDTIEKEVSLIPGDGISRTALKQSICL